MAECWQCIQGACGYFSGFCSNGVCGISSEDVLGHCERCGVYGPLGGDACSELVPCRAGYSCFFQFGTTGFCQPES